MRSFYFEKSLKNDLFWEFSPNMFFLSAGTYFHYAVLPIAEGVEFSPFFRRPTSKKRRKFGIFRRTKKLCFFGRAKAFAQKNSQKRYFLGEFSRIHFSSFILFLVMFLHSAFWVVHDFRRSGRKNCIFSDRKNYVFSGIRKNVVFSSHGSRITVRKNPGYLAGWLSG